MSQNPIEQATIAATREAATGAMAAAPGTELEVINPAELPALLGVTTIPIRAWIGALVEAEQFEEADEEDAQLSMVRAILLAETPAQMFASMTVLSVKDLLGDDPGARSNVFEIYGATPLKSTFAEGASCFAIIRARDLAEGVDVTLSCGARSVQAAIVGHMIHGWLPAKAVFTRKRKPTRSGFYPVNLESGI